MRLSYIIILSQNALKNRSLKQDNFENNDELIDRMSTEVGSIHIEGIPATSKEIEEIEMLLKGGVIL